MRIDAPTIIMWILMIGGGVSALYFALSFFKGGKRSKRIKMVINKERGELGKKQIDDLNKSSAVRQLKSKDKWYVGIIAKIYSTLNMQSLLSSEEVRNSLSQAGFRGRSVLMVYYTCRVIGVVAGFLLTLLFIAYGIKDFSYPDIMRYVFAAVGAFVGFNMPKILITNAAQKRQTEMNKAFPDTMDLLVICVEAGLSIEAAFNRVTEEIMESSPILAQELGLTTAELAYLGDRRKAYMNFATRTGLPSAKSLATTLIQSEQYGTPVGVALKVLSQEKRDERMAYAEKKAASLPAKLTVPMIIFFLPVLFVVVIGPAAMRISGLN